MEARCSRWGGGPAMPRGKVLGSGAAGRSPGVRPVFEPVVALRSREKCDKVTLLHHRAKAN